MPFISQASIQEVKDRLDAVAVVSDYVKLEQKGGRWWACCPFHQEKTGSFTVNPDIKTYYCFGCHKGGTIINFVQEMDKLTFPETIELLAKRFGVELVYENSGGNFSGEDEARKKAKDELFELYQRISGTFHHFLMEKREAEAAKVYIISRGININMIEKFRLGYAPADRYWLHKFLTQKGYSREFLLTSGLFSSRYPGLSLFSDRLMFPIADRQGRVVAFGGRYLPGGAAPVQSQEGREPPKYINSPELSIYKKGETLFAVDLALAEIRRTKTVYIAEGYMDVIALHQAGIINAVAPLGTAFTDDQAKLLKRWAEKAVFFFDSDEAGQAAALKGIYTCRRNGLACAIIRPGIEGLEEDLKKTGTEGGSPAVPKDPADILLHFGPEALQKKAKCFINDFDYLLTRAGAFFGSSGTEGQRSFIQEKARAVAFLFPYFDLLDSEVARNSCIEAAADSIGLLPDVVAEDYRKYVSGRSSTNRTPGIREDAYSRQSGEVPEGRDAPPIRMNDELSLLVVVALDYVTARKEKLFDKFRTALEISEIEDYYAKEIYIALEECLRYEETGMDELLARISSHGLKKFLVERSASGEFSINPEQLMVDGIKKITVKRLERQNDEIIIKLRGIKKLAQGTSNGQTNAGEGSSNDDWNSEVNDLLTEKMRIDNELHLLKQGRYQ